MEVCAILRMAFPHLHFRQRTAEDGSVGQHYTRRHMCHAFLGHPSSDRTKFVHLSMNINLHCILSWIYTAYEFCKPLSFLAVHTELKGSFVILLVQYVNPSYVYSKCSCYSYSTQHTCKIAIIHSLQCYVQRGSHM